MDATKKYRKHYLSINLQHVENSEIIIYNLSTIQFTDNAPRECFANIVRNVINEYCLHPSNCISITVDNGRNMIFSVNNLNTYANSDHFSSF